MSSPTSRRAEQRVHQATCVDYRKALTSTTNPSHGDVEHTQERNGRSAVPPIPTQVHCQHSFLGCQHLLTSGSDSVNKAPMKATRCFLHSKCDFTSPRPCAVPALRQHHILGPTNATYCSHEIAVLATHCSHKTPVLATHCSNEIPVLATRCSHNSLFPRISRA